MVIIVGAGPAGLATAATLARRGIEHRLLEQGDSLGHSWRHLYDSLRLHTGKHLSHLPGLPIGRAAALFPSRDEFVHYLERYAQHFALRVETGQSIVAAERVTAGWRVRTATGATATGSALVMASGIIANPRRPRLAGERAYGGRLLHSVEYRRPDEFVGRRVLVVGVGNSGGEIGAELARAGAQVTVLVRSGANVVPLTLGGIPIQYFAYAMRRLPRGAREGVLRVVNRAMRARHGPPVLPRPDYSALDAIPLIGFHLVQAIREGRITLRRGAIASLRPAGAAFSDGTQEDFDAIILATGFAPALEPLGSLVRRDERGFALRQDRITSADQPDLYFVGHNYDSTGGLSNIRRDAQLVAQQLAR